MLQIVYVSAAIAPLALEDLHHLLVLARAKNVIHRVTGMLLYDSGSFLQVLEGPDTAVEQIFAGIQRDPRHHQIKVLIRQPIDHREFPEWSMGFMDTSHWNLPNGLIDYHLVPEAAAARTAAQRYLRLFHQGLCRQAIPQ